MIIIIKKASTMEQSVMTTQNSEKSNARRVIAVLCHTDACCPTIALDEAAEMAQRVVIEDDFGQSVRMSREQFQVLIDLAQAGKLVL
jgi:hypothetical protein